MSHVFLEFVIPCIHQWQEIFICETCSQSEYHIHAMKHVMLIAEAGKLRIVYHDHSF
jgi:hypothetical protein